MRKRTEPASTNITTEMANITMRVRGTVAVIAVAGVEVKKTCKVVGHLLKSRYVIMARSAHGCVSICGAELNLVTDLGPMPFLSPR